MGIAELEAEVLKLAPQDQARLLHRLAQSLDAFETVELTNEELEKRWADFQASGEVGIESSVLREQTKRNYGLS